MRISEQPLEIVIVRPCLRRIVPTGDFLLPVKKRSDLGEILGGDRFEIESGHACRLFVFVFAGNGRLDAFTGDPLGQPEHLVKQTVAGTS